MLIMENVKTVLYSVPNVKIQRHVKHVALIKFYQLIINVPITAQIIPLTSMESLINAKVIINVEIATQKIYLNVLNALEI